MANHLTPSQAEGVRDRYQDVIRLCIGEHVPMTRSQDGSSPPEGNGGELMPTGKLKFLARCDGAP